uniref:Reverse transcriptase domain-containing protein n=1 Tax=Arundo donax TaxID=35708 RepID=A0A0A9E3E3_ARUDO
MFTSQGAARVQEIIEKVNARVTPDMNDSLNAPYNDDEIDAALQGIGDLKAPGPDGMPAIFFKRFWDIVGARVRDEVKMVLNGGDIPDGWNETTVVLIPKVKDPQQLKDLRPISLCNVLYKIISKAIANRLKVYLGETISPNQSAFVPGRLITDNVLVAYELTHFIKNKRRGNEGYMALKLDMSKAYDRVDWNFFEAMLSRLGFDHTFVQLIMKCVRTVRYRIKVNGELTDEIMPQQSLRQGDPLSPYLFLMVAEGFSSLLHHAEASNMIQGIQICQGAPSVSHLLFADNSLILMKASEANAEQLQSILDLYESSSGQKINKEKSAVMFSRNTKANRRDSIKRTLAMTSEMVNEKYLGLPVYVSHSKKKAFQYLKDRIWNRIQGWREKLLSKARKEILIKAVAQAIPTYAMACFDLTKSFRDDASAMICRYWWSQQDKDKMHWVSWDKMLQTKSNGGLGFRDLHAFNQAMLAKQGWRLIQNPGSLCARVLGAKYYPDGHVLNAQKMAGMSYTWRSVLKGISLLKKGIIWRVGDGASIDIWNDPWLPCGVTRKPSTIRGQTVLHRVSELLNPDTFMG